MIARRAALALVALGATAATAAADNPLSADDDVAASFADREALHLDRAAAATARGDAETAAAELVIACNLEVYVSYNPAAPTCAKAESAVAPYPYLQSRLLGTMGCFSAWMLDWAGAHDRLTKALAVAAGGPAGDTLAGEGVRFAHLCLGVIAREQGAYDDAQRELDLLLAQSEHAGDRGLTIQARIWKCRLDVGLGDRIAGEDDCTSAVALATAAHDYVNLGNAYWNAGEFALESDDVAGAIALWEAGRDMNPVPFSMAAIRVSLAEAYTLAGRYDDAERELAALQAAIDAGTLPSVYLPQHAAVRGALLAARGDHAGAIAEYDRAIAASPMYSAVLYALQLRAKSQAALGDLAGAEASLETAVGKIEAGRARAPGEDQRRTYMDRHAEIYRALVATVIARGGDGAADHALEVAEAGRARALLDAIRVAGVDAPPPGPLDAAAIRAAVGAGRTLILYVSTDDALYAIRVTTDAVATIALPAAGTRDQLAARVAYYQQLVADVDEPSELDAAGGALYHDVLAPVLGAAPAGTIVIGPDGPLHGLPFDALRVDGTFVIERADVAITPSGSLLARAPVAEPAPRVLAVAAPDLAADQAPLPASTDEVGALAAEITPAPTILTGAAATKPALLAAAPSGYRVLHFATHASVDATLPLRSALALAPSAGDDGKLRADEIYRLHLGTDVVVLSGCETAAGAASTSEGPMSLARAFLHAGAGAVVATLWRVDDRQGPPFMARLYRDVARGRSMAQAVGDAKRDLAHAHAPPRTWAAYTLIGGAGVVVGLAPHPASGRMFAPRTWLVLVLGGAGLLSIVVGLLLRRR